MEQRSWEFQYSVKDKESNNIVHSKLKYDQAISEAKVKELIGKALPNDIKANFKRHHRWKTLQQASNIIYCKKQNNRFSILAKIKLLQPPGGEPCSTLPIFECNAS